MAKNLNEFLEPLKSLTISSLDEKGYPFSSYAPFVKYNGKYYVYLSLMAKHSSNLTKNKIASIFFCEDEQDCKNIFGKKRVSIQCETLKLEQDTQDEINILDESNENDADFKICGKISRFKKLKIRLSLVMKLLRQTN